MTGKTSLLRLHPKVRLAPLQSEHAPAMYQWVCDPVVRLNIGLSTEPSLEKTRAWIEAATADPSFKPFAVLLENRHVGNVVLDRIDRTLETARLSIYIGDTQTRGAGIGTSAVYLALREGFQTLRLHKIWLTVHANNSPAIRCYSKLGFLLEGILRDEFRLEGQRLPAIYMGMLADEFSRLRVESTGVGEQA